MRLSDFNFENHSSNDFWKNHSPEGGFSIMTMNAEIYYMVKSQGDWGDIIKRVGYFVCDGVGLALGYRFLTGKEAVKCSGADLVESLIEQFPKTPTYIWGTTEENIQKAAKAYKKRGLNLVGFHNGFTGQEEEILKEIKRSGAKLCFIGMGGRRQMEITVLVNKRLGITTMNVGGTFDVASGKFIRAPKAAQRLGLEWLWRMAIEPKRLKRLPALFGFVWFVALEKIGSVK